MSRVDERPAPAVSESAARSLSAAEQIVDVSLCHESGLVLLNVVQGEINDVLEFTPDRAEMIARQLWQGAIDLRRSAR